MSRMISIILVDDEGLTRAGIRLLAQKVPDVKGMTNKEIAVALSITAKTVEKHRTEVVQRLGVHNSAALVRCALQNGLVQ